MKSTRYNYRFTYWEQYIIAKVRIEEAPLKTLPPGTAGPKPDTAVSGERPPAHCLGTGGETLEGPTDA